MSRLITIAAVMTDNESLMGNAHQTPQIGAHPISSKSSGKHNIRGIRYNTWRVKLRKIALEAMPMDV